MMPYDIFFRRFVVRRRGDLSGSIPLSSLTGLPTGSVLHLVDHLNMNYVDDPLPFPDVNSSLYKLEPPKKVIYSQLDFINGDNTPVKVEVKGIRVLGMGVTAQLIKFKSENSPNVLFTDSIVNLPERRGVQAIVNYNPLYRVRAHGLLARFRLFNSVITTVLNNVISMSNRDHFIHIPITNLTFTKPDFVRSFKEQTKVTLKYPENPHYLFLVQLLSYIENNSTSSLFEQIPGDIVPKINLVITNGDKCVIYRLDILNEMNKAGNQALLKVIDQLNGLIELAVPADTIETVVTPKVPEQLIVVDSADPRGNTTGLKVPATTEKIRQESIEAIEELDTTSERVIEEDQKLTPAQKTRVKIIAKKYKDIKISGVPIIKVLEESNEQDIEDESVNSLDAGLVDVSMAKSSINGFNKSYVKKALKKDLASSLTSLGSQGMFLSELEEKDVSDDLNQITEYTARYEDINGSKHTIKFSLPKVDSNGNCTINGSLKSVRMQRINVPICKVSPTRVALNTNYNKALVERNVAKAHNYYEFVRVMLDKTEGKWSADFASQEYKDIPLPYDYSALARHIRSLTTKAFAWSFSYHDRFDGVAENLMLELANEEANHGVYLGSGGEKNEIQYFVDTQGVLTKRNKNTKEVVDSTTIVDELFEVLDAPKKQLTEWVYIKGLKGVSKKFPVIFMLCYRYGMNAMLEYVNVDYVRYEPNERVETKPSDIILKFQDGKLVIKGVPKQISLLFAGLTDYDLSNVLIEEMDEKDVYFDLIQQKGLPVYYLRNIDTVFDMFIDPITRDVLAQMGEPTNMRDLLIRCVSLLSTEDHKPASSSVNYRFRSYELFSAIVYKSLANALDNFKQGSFGSKKKFSISSYEIMQEIMSDPLMRNVDTINPIADIKEKCGFSHVGEGGRSAQAFVIEDRKYPDDGVGIISEATVDSGKVAIDAMLSMDPNIVNTRGLTQSRKPEDVSATSLLSVTSLLVAGADQDD